MSDRGLAALFLALTNSPTPHLDDETLSRIVDAELAGDNVDLIFNEQISHMETCETCASTYSELFLMMAEIVDNMAQTAETLTLPTSENILDKSTIAEQSERIWQQVFIATAQRIQNQFRLTLKSPQAQIAEPKPSYEAGDERPLISRPLPDSPLQIIIRLSRQTIVTCRLTVQLKGPEGTELAGFKIALRYGGQIESAETGPGGLLNFENIPITALPNLEITAELKA